MKYSRTFYCVLLFAALTLGAAAGCAQRSTAAKSLAAGPVQTANLTIGKELFVARCASCHDENGAKPLRAGLPLAQRKLSREVVTKAVQGRLKEKSQAERDAVVEYILSFQASAKR